MKGMKGTIQVKAQFQVFSIGDDIKQTMITTSKGIRHLPGYGILSIFFIISSGGCKFT
jgi:hypothetical protein